MTTTQNSAFKTALKNSILAYIRKAKKDGTTGIAPQSLALLVQTPDTNLDGAPEGAKARYYYMEMFWEICYDNNDLRIQKFLL